MAQLLTEHLNSNQLGNSENSEKINAFQNSGAPGAAVNTPEDPLDPDLRDVIQHWPHLPEPIKAAILAMVRAAEST